VVTFKPPGSYKNMCHFIASNIRDCVKTHNTPVLGLATGSTFIGVYNELRKMKNTNFSDTYTVNLDEYVGLEPEFNARLKGKEGYGIPQHKQSYYHFMTEHLFKHITFKRSFFPGESQSDTFDSLIAAMGGIDIQILGIGTNGHIAFNEPGTSRDSLTHVVDLTESTIKDNSRFFDSIEDVPKQATTMGIESIMRAKRIYLLAHGKHKKDIFEKAFKGEITPDVPASFLQEHSDCTVMYCD
jgi:glucosamine-6-phosphate deaminase